MCPRNALSLSETWTYALLGGVASMPLTVGTYWLSGAGSHFSLNAVVVAGLIAAYLARGTTVDGTAAGVRAGVVGSFPGVAWALSASIPAAIELTDPAPFRIVAVGIAVGPGIGAVVIGALAGLVGGKVGGWLARRVSRRSGPQSAGRA